MLGSAVGKELCTLVGANVGAYVGANVSIDASSEGTLLGAGVCGRVGFSLGTSLCCTEGLLVLHSSLQPDGQ